MTKLHDNSPVFCTAKVPTEILNDFFRLAYSPPELVDELGADNIDVGMFIIIHLDVARLKGIRCAY
jgi:hypothetical protein